MCFLELLFNFFCIFIFIQFLLNAGGGDGKLIIKGPRPKDGPSNQRLKFGKKSGQ